jgi:hypothetical protein
MRAMQNDTSKLGLLASTAMVLAACAASSPTVPGPDGPSPAPGAAAPAADASKVLPTGDAAAPAAQTQPTHVAGTARLGSRGVAGATVNAYLVGGPEAAAATGTTAADGTFDLDLGTAARAGMLVKIVVTQNGTTLAAIQPAQAGSRAAYTVQEAQGYFVDSRTTLVVMLFREELITFGSQMHTANDRVLAEFSGALTDAVAAADAAINRMGAAFEAQLIVQATTFFAQGVLPLTVAQQLTSAAKLEVDVMLKQVHRMNQALADAGSKEAKDAVDNPKPLDLGNGVTVVPPGAPAPTTTSTATSTSGGGGSGGGGSGGGGSSGGGSSGSSGSSDSAATDAAASTAVQVRGTFTPAKGNLAAPNLESMEVHFRNGATVFDLTFSQPIFGWEDTTRYVFAAAASPSVENNPTQVRSLSDGFEHLPMATVSVQGDVDPKVVHVVVPDNQSTTFVPSGATAVHIRIKPGLKNQDGVALGTSGASFTKPTT